MSSQQMYAFEPLELRRFSRIDVPGLEIVDDDDDDGMAPPASQPQCPSEAPSASFTTTYTPSDNGSDDHDRHHDHDNDSRRKLAFGSSSSATAYYPPSASDAPIHHGYRRPSSPSPSSRADTQALRTSLLQRKRRRFLPTWITAVLAVAMSSLSVWYAWRVMVDRAALPAALLLSPGVTVLVVNILSHVVAYLCWSLASDTMEALRWALACGPDGILLTSFLALSRATPLVGVAYLCSVRGQHWIWAVQRYAAFSVSRSGWLSGDWGADVLAVAERVG
jgi:hypothetical protein